LLHGYPLLNIFVATVILTLEDTLLLSDVFRRLISIVKIAYTVKVMYLYKVHSIFVPQNDVERLELIRSTEPITQNVSSWYFFLMHKNSGTWSKSFPLAEIHINGKHGKHVAFSQELNELDGEKKLHRW
jgi:hypothetical protein